MTRPDPRQQAALSAAFAGAVDLSALKNRPAGPPPSPATASGADPAAPGTSGDTPYVATVTEASFGAAVQTSAEVLVLFELWSPRSPVGAELSASLISLAGQGNGAWILARVDVDTNPRVAQAFQVQAIPTVVAVAGGQPVDAFSGPQPQTQIQTWIASLLDTLRDRLPGIKAAEDAAGGPLPVPEDPRLTAAEALLEEGDYDAARDAYQAILNAEPGNADATAALAQVEFLVRAETVAPDAIAVADANPTDVELQKAAADLEIASGSVEEAFDRLVGAVRVLSGDERAAARAHLVSLFVLFPADDERVRVARRKLAAALY